MNCISDFYTEFQRFFVKRWISTNFLRFWGPFRAPYFTPILLVNELDLTNCISDFCTKFHKDTLKIATSSVFTDAYRDRWIEGFLPTFENMYRPKNKNKQTCFNCFLLSTWRTILSKIWGFFWPSPQPFFLGWNSEKWQKCDFQTHFLAWSY